VKWGVSSVIASSTAARRLDRVRNLIQTLKQITKRRLKRSIPIPRLNQLTRQPACIIGAGSRPIAQHVIFDHRPALPRFI
jgi:hypothetical protein